MKSHIIKGTVVRTGVSRGKTMAAWNGIPSTQAFMVIKLDQGQKAETLREEVYVWFPNDVPNSMEILIGKHIQLVGQWVHPPKRKTVDINQPMQQPIMHVHILDLQSPITLDIEDDEITDEVNEIHPISSPSTHTLVKSESVKSESDKVWIPIERQPHFQASKMIILH